MYGLGYFYPNRLSWLASELMNVNFQSASEPIELHKSKTIDARDRSISTVERGAAMSRPPNFLLSILILLLAWSSALANVSDQQDFDELLTLEALGHDYKNDRRLPEALECFKALGERDPKHANAFY